MIQLHPGLQRSQHSGTRSFFPGLPSGGLDVQTPRFNLDRLFGKDWPLLAGFLAVVFLGLGVGYFVLLNSLQ